VSKNLPASLFPEFKGKRVSWADFVEQCQDEELNHYGAPIMVMEHFDTALSVEEAVDRFERDVLASSVSLGDADVVLSTAQAAKGLEWERVFLCDDFVDVLGRDLLTESFMPIVKRPWEEFMSGTVAREMKTRWKFKLYEGQFDELNCLYVAMTRAKSCLYVCPALSKRIKQFDDLRKWVQGEDKGEAIPFGHNHLSFEQALEVHRDLVAPLYTSLQVDGGSIWDHLFGHRRVSTSKV